MYKVTFVSNVTYEPIIRQALHDDCFQHEIQIEFVLPEEIQQKNWRHMDLVIFALSFEQWLPNIEIQITSHEKKVKTIEEEIVDRSFFLYEKVKELTGAKVIWFGFEDYYVNQHYVCGSLLLLDGVVDKINLRLSHKISKDDTYIDFKRIIAEVGIQDSFSTVSKYRWNMPYAKKLIYYMCKEIDKQIKIEKSESPKCVVIDCDNVLWGGILSEDGMDGIILGDSGLGLQYQELQRFLLSLYYRGIILAICSKNDETDVLRVFREHSGMILKEEHISCFKCNWDDKPQNIKSIAAYLNISLNSIVFIDDSTFEINGVKCVFPEISTILYDKKNIFQNLSCFNVRNIVNINIIKQRTETYKSNVQRELLKKNSVSFDMYLKMLEIKLDIHETQVHELMRIAELTQRTNKCTNGRRYTIDELKRLFSCKEYAIYTICVSDRFSDLGIVGAVILREKTMELFSLSCRALGRNIEEQILKFFKNTHNVDSVEWVNTIQNKNFVEKILDCSYKIIDSSR